MIQVPTELEQRLRRYGQEHVLAWWDRLTDKERRELVGQLEGLDLELLNRLFAQRERSFGLPPPERIAPVPVVRLEGGDAQARQLGEEALRRGQVAVLVVAGGQGSRLGFDHPKGLFPIGPVSNKTLFQLHAEKVRALSRRYGRPIPALILTSPATHAETVAFGQAHDFFGLPREDVFIVTQGTMPALDRATGKLLLEAPGRLFTSPNGHGGTLTVLADAGLLGKLDARGVRHLFYFQVDNPLVQIADPVFLGHHLAAQAEVSSKVIAKHGPDDRLGNLVLIDGRCGIIEYSDVDGSSPHREHFARRDEQGRLVFWAGNPAIHVFSLDFLRRVTAGRVGLPFHPAAKKVPYLDASGQLVQPAVENALKFEMFIFDVLPLADRWTVVETSRREEFAPLKNGTGPDSPATVRQALSDLWADWLGRAGVAVPRTAAGAAAVPVEISPLFALDADELARKLPPGTAISGPTYLAE
jgi:UDP-N-acetylglucosamine/UDP-N-acetylgalactosamine diphosphorylase